MLSPCCGYSCAVCVLRLTEAPVGTGATIVDAVFGPAASGDIQYAHSPRQGGMWAKAAESIILASISMSQCKQGRHSRLSRRTHESADACTHRIQTGIRVHVTSDKVCRSATVTPPRRQTMRQGGSLQLCCGAAHTESTCYTACIHIRFWPLHGPLTGLGSSAAVQTVANRRSRRCGRAGVMVQVWSLGKRGVGLRRVVRCGGGSARSGFTCRALGLRQCCGSGSACC